MLGDVVDSYGEGGGAPGDPGKVSGGRRSHAFPMEDASGKHTKSDGKSPFLVSKPRNSMISMVIFNSNLLYLLSEGPC